MCLVIFFDIEKKILKFYSIYSENEKEEEK